MIIIKGLQCEGIVLHASHYIMYSFIDLCKALVTPPNFDNLVDSTTSIHFIPYKFDLWYKMYGGGRI